MEKLIRTINDNVNMDNTFMGEDGLLYCSICGEPRQAIVDMPTIGEMTVNLICGCMKQAMAENDTREREETADRLRAVCFGNKAMKDCTFENSECEKEYKDIMQSYVNNFSKFKSKGKGLILCGKVGTGKTFLASCVANALIDKGVKVLMTNLREIESGVWENKQQYIDSLNSYSLLVIDDLGVERNTEYMQELMYGVVNSRYAAGLPMIITTNLTIEELKRPKDIGSSRIYERILERCYPIEVKGSNKRRMIIRNEYDETRELLGIKKGEQNG